MKVKLYIVQGEHFSQPGHILKHFTDKALAIAEAVSLVNIMLADTDWPTIGAGNWKVELSNLQDHHGAAHCDVWIDETEIEVAIPTPAVAKKYLLALDLSSGIDLQHFDSDEEREAAIWEIAFHSTITDATTVEEFRKEYEDEDYDYCDAMEDAEIGFLTDEVSVAPVLAIEQDKIFVVIEEGAVQDVVAQGPAIGATVTTIDYDAEGGDADDFTPVLQSDGEHVNAYVREWTVEKAAISVPPKDAA